jgi:hydroxypyruvate isomerase
MMTHTLPYLANCSMLFTETPLLERPAAARAAGFDAIEFWWPFDVAVPADSEVAAFVDAIDASGVQLVGLNFFAGNLAGPEAGLASIPGRSQEFRDGVEVAVGIAGALHASVFNALYGVRLDGVTPAAQDELATDNLAFAASVAARIGATILIEPLSGPKPYPLRTADDVVAVVQRVRAAGATNVGWLCDLFHLATNDDDISAAIAAHHGDIAHVQIADAPGRGEPGSGSVDFERYLGELQQVGYSGWVGLEYNPTTTTDESLHWLPRQRRAAARAGGTS